MKYCVRCGAQIEDESWKFCQKCGSEIPVSSASNLSSTSSDVEPSPTIQPSPNSPVTPINSKETTIKSNKKLLIGLAAIAALLVIAIGVMISTGAFSDLFGDDARESYSRDEDEDDDEDEEGDDSSESKGPRNFASGLGALFGRRSNESPAATASTTPDVTEPSSAPHVSGSITVMSYNESFQKIIENNISNDLPNIQCTFLLTPNDIYKEKLKIMFVSGDAPDVFTCEEVDTKDYIQSYSLLDLTDLGHRAYENGTMGYAIDFGRSSNGSIYALPLEASPGAMFYRRSLASKYLGTDNPIAVQEMFSDYRNLHDTALLLYNKSGGKCRLTSLDDMNLPLKALRHKPWLSDPSYYMDEEIINFLPLYKDLRDKGCLAPCTQWSEDWYKGMNDSMTDSNGKSVEIFSYFFPKWGLDYVLKSHAEGAGTSTVGDWAMIKGPFNYFWGGTWVCADGYTESPDAARQFIEYITMNESFLEKWSLEINNMVTNLYVNDRLQDNGADSFLMGQNTYLGFNEISKYIDGNIYSRDDRAIERIFDENLWNYLDGAITLEDMILKFNLQMTAGEYLY